MVEDKMRVVDVRKLKECIGVLFDHIIDSGIDQISIENQYYWQVEESQEYDLQHQPEGYAVGDLFDDLATADRVLSNKEVAVSYTLAELAPIVAYVGKAAGRRLASKGG
jgi:hypothetical protein